MVEKLVRLLADEVEKLTHENLTPPWQVGTPSVNIGTLISTLARENENLARFWQVGTWANRPSWDAWHMI